MHTKRMICVVITSVLLASTPALAQTVKMAGEMKGSGIMNAAQAGKMESSRMSCTALRLAWSMHRSHEDLGEHLSQSRPGNAWNFQRQ